MTQGTQDRFRRILEAARKRDGGSSTDTMIVNSHLSQMKLFMLRQGLEFIRHRILMASGKQFLSALIEENEIDTRLEGVVDDFLIDGKGLFISGQSVTPIGLCGSARTTTVLTTTQWVSSRRSS